METNSFIKNAKSFGKTFLVLSVLGFFLLGNVFFKKKILEKQKIEYGRGAQVSRIIESLHKKYCVPRKFLYSVVHHETGYYGLWHDTYRWNRGNIYLGSCQIHLDYAQKIWNNSRLSSFDLLNNPELNIETACKILSWSYSETRSWNKTFAYYNTGKPYECYYSRRVSSFNMRVLWDPKMIIWKRKYE